MKEELLRLAERLRLRCPKCLRKGDAARDETDPPNAVLAIILCPKCDDGDRHSPEYWDAANRWIDPVAHLQVRASVKEQNKGG